MKYSLGKTEISVKPSKGKFLRLKVDGKTADVFVYVPRGISEMQVRVFILEKQSWIEQSREAILQKISATNLPEDKAMLFGRLYDISYSDSGFVSEVALSVPSYSSSTVKQSALERFYRKKLAEYIACSLPEIERAVGLRAKALAIRKMTSRWGSCNVSTGKITFSLALAQKEKPCIDYVILHELVHLRYADHGAQFKAMLTLYMPDWKKRKKDLNGVLKDYAN